MPGNVRWATPLEQSHNRYDNLRFTLNGETRLIGEWSRIKGIKYTTIWERIRAGWSIEKALTHPTRASGRK